MQFCRNIFNIRALGMKFWSILNRPNLQLENIVKILRYIALN